MPSMCPCGKQFTLDHAVSCLKGGFIHRRHDDLRNIFAEIMKDVSSEVSIEPQLQPLTGKNLSASSNKSKEARLDIATRGFWQSGEMAFFDVRVFNPFAKSHQNKSLKSQFALQEKEKKRSYNQRVIQIEHGSFTPVVLSAYGGTGRETHHFIKTLVEKLAKKSGIEQSVVTNYIRTKISFAQTRALINCIRGSRSRYRTNINTDDIELSDNAMKIQER